MERIRLTKEERRVLRWLSHERGALASMPPASFCRAARSLERRGLVRVRWRDGDEGFMRGELTGDGKGYMEVNPACLTPWTGRRWRPWARASRRLLPWPPSWWRCWPAPGSGRCEGAGLKKR